MSFLEQEKLAKDYLAQHSVLHLSTLCEQKPYSVSVFYLHLDWNLYYVSSQTSRHSQNLKENEWASFTVAGHVWHWKEIQGLQGEGRVVEVSSSKEQKDVFKSYVEKYPDVKTKLFLATKLKQFLRRPAPVFYKIIPTQLHWFDNSEQFGYKAQLI